MPVLSAIESATVDVLDDLAQVVAAVNLVLISKILADLAFDECSARWPSALKLCR